MKKNILLLILLALAMHKANAQIGLNNNSDWKVPVPVFIPQFAPDFKAVNGISVPNVPVIPIPAITPFPSFTPASLLPTFPAAPNAPTPPDLATFTLDPPAVSSLKYPSLQILPPLPSLAPLPIVRDAK